MKQSRAARDLRKLMPRLSVSRVLAGTASLHVMPAPASFWIFFSTDWQATSTGCPAASSKCSALAAQLRQPFRKAALYLMVKGTSIYMHTKL
jgi:hypothetical protein